VIENIFAILLGFGQEYQNTYSTQSNKLM